MGKKKEKKKPYKKSKNIRRIRKRDSSFPNSNRKRPKMPGHFLEDRSQNIAGYCRSNDTKRDSTQALVVVNEISTLSDRSNREIVGFHKSNKATGRLDRKSV